MDVCEDCGIPLDRHGADCGIEGGPGGWADPYGNRFDLDTLTPQHPRRACRICGRHGLVVAACYELANASATRVWLYRCSGEGCAREHVYLPERGLFALEPAEEDDSEIQGRAISLELAGDPL